MKNMIKKSSIYIVVALLSISGVGCNSWLDLKPDNKQTSDDYWKSKEDVDAVVHAMYFQLRNCEPQFFRWGELRGDMISLMPTSSADEKSIRSLDILTTNSIVKWAEVYKAIGYANAILKYAPGVLSEDITFDPNLLKSYLGEARFVRALCNFYLLRTFRQFPYVTEPYVNDEVSYSKGKDTEERIIAGILEDLNGIEGAGISSYEQGAVKMCKPGYGSKFKNKGRATKWAAYMLLADVSLWIEDYETTISACNAVISSGQYDLLSANFWYNIFAQGNTAESIFELQWKSDDFSYYFNDFIGNIYIKDVYNITLPGRELFEKETEVDLRGRTVSYLPDGKIWKYAGYETSIDGTSTRYMSNNGWIFYRYSEVPFMLAEALIMKSNIPSAEFDAAWELIRQMRGRAGLSIMPPTPSGKREAMEILMNERSKEFFAEGKRWFDILRYAKKSDYSNKDYLLEVLMTEISAQQRPVFIAKLADPNGYYLPINQADIESNGQNKKTGAYILQQNPYYDNLDK